MKLKMNKIFNNINSESWSPEEVVIETNTGIKQKLNKKEDNAEVIRLSSSDFDNISTISMPSTSEESSDTFSLNFPSTSSDESSRPSVYKNSFFRKKQQERALSASCAENSIKKIKKHEITQQVQEPTQVQDFPSEHQELYRHKLHRQCNKNIKNHLNNTDEEQLKEEININQMRGVPQEILRTNNHNQTIEESIPSWNSFFSWSH